jgi:hypothetical protein
LGGIWTEHDLVHEKQLMVMLSNDIVCWRDPRQLRRDEKRIRMSSCAGVISGNAIWSCPMHSNVIVCWCGLVSDIACGQAFERHRVPGDLRQRDRVLPQVALLVQPPNRRLQLTPLRVERDRCFLKRSFGSNAISLYRCGATEARVVGPL